MRRHPHVFGEVEAETAGRVRSNWETIKREQEGRSGIFHDVPETPARRFSTRARCSGAPQRSTSSIRTCDGALADLDDELRELKEAIAAAGGEPAPETEPDPHVFEELGDVLFAAVNVARRVNVDPELALRAMSQRFRDRVERAEERAAADGRGLRAS